MEPCFKLRVHIGGNFVEGDTLKYVGDSVEVFPYVDLDKMSLVVLKAEISGLGFTGIKSIWFKNPTKEISDPDGVMELENDMDVLGMCKMLVGQSEGDIYVEHEITEAEEQSLNEQYVDEDDQSVNEDEAVNYSDGYLIEDDHDDEDVCAVDVNGKSVHDHTSISINPSHKINYDKGYKSDSESLKSLDSSGDEGGNQNVYPKFSYPADRSTIDFCVGMLFHSIAELKQTIFDYAILNHRNIRLVKSDRNRVRARCSDGCKWTLYGAKLPDAFTVQVRTYVSEHSCSRTYKNPNLSAKWIADNMLETIRQQPNIMGKALQAQVESSFGMSCSRNKAFRARQLALKKTEGDHIEQYKHVRDYCAEILRTNPGSTCIIKCDTESMPINDSSSAQTLLRFARMYISLAASKKGFVEACRPVIGIDGCHLKGPCGGIMLTAVGKDPNESLFPLAVAVVESENRDSWTWFLEILIEDIGRAHSTTCTFISDQQKGLIPALQQLLPGIEHRFCVRHLHSNFQKLHRGLELKKLMWMAARATYKQAWEQTMERIKQVSEPAWNYLMKLDPKVWCRHAFRYKSKCASLTNNMSETFNSTILVAREKPVITMMEIIRVSLMTKYQENRENSARWNRVICPQVHSKLEVEKKKVKDWICRFAGEEKFEISNPYHAFSVDLVKKECTCRKWDITGIPCVHAISAIFHKNVDPELYVDKYYSVEAYRTAYKNIVYPINGQEMWTKTGMVEPMPPVYKRRPGRPKKLRRLEPEERKNGSASNLGKHGVRMKCTRCNTYGHNKRSCKVNGTMTETTSRRKQKRTTNTSQNEGSTVTDLNATQDSVSGPIFHT